jgi:hypothetical protein
LRFLALWTIVAAAVGSLPYTAQAASLQITGTAGHLSEWKLDAEVTARDGQQEFHGPVLLKHVGLCSANGPEEKSGYLTVVVSNWARTSRVQAKLIFGAVECTYSGTGSDSSSGHMDCSDAKGVPLTLSFR